MLLFFAYAYFKEKKPSRENQFSSGILYYMLYYVYINKTTVCNLFFSGKGLMDVFQFWEFKEQNPGPLEIQYLEIGQRHCILLPKIFIIICILYYMFIYIIYMYILYTVYTSQRLSLFSSAKDGNCLFCLVSVALVGNS